VFSIKTQYAKSKKAVRYSYERSTCISKEGLAYVVDRSSGATAITLLLIAKVSS